MNINWKLRFKNKTTLTAIVLATIAFVYQVFGMFGVVPSVSKSEIVEVVGLLINILVLVGVVTDPTTSGISDSTRAMNYTEPRKDEK